MSRVARHIASIAALGILMVIPAQGLAPRRCTAFR